MSSQVIDIFKQKNGVDILQLRNKGSKMFNALHKNSDLKWKITDSEGNYVIPYVIAARYDPKELPSIRQAMDRIEANTCIRFRERTNEHDYIEIQNQPGQGCYTNVGRADGKGVLMLESNNDETCLEVGTVLHELMHVIGLWHEHMRYDRDQYIKVHYENIDKEYWTQFDKVMPDEATTYNIPYDYKSVMHYDKTAFAQEGKISMETMDPKFQDVIGNQNDASPSDYKKICKIYQCRRCMSENTNTNNGSETEKTEPVTVGPFPNTAQGCHDLSPVHCRTLARIDLLDCSYFGRQQCCATCMALGIRSKNT
ncbi:astacin [Oesophagostomum dentatum]|uniref:Metalloendopeptidase n=1 Tax=Oesophagostomum dentatum TaxID=61180 RepID=A0A0B1T7N3_OESDE|nr:astacin [Oesophagostomum dentatum]